MGVRGAPRRKGVGDGRGADLGRPNRSRRRVPPGRGSVRDLSSRGPRRRRGSGRQREPRRAASSSRRPGGRPGSSSSSGAVRARPGCRRRSSVSISARGVETTGRAGGAGARGNPRARRSARGARRVAARQGRRGRSRRPEGVGRTVSRRLATMSRRFDVITFDCYGTLVDWEGGIAEAFIREAEADAFPLDRVEVVEAYHDVEPHVEASAVPALSRRPRGDGEARGRAATRMASLRRARRISRRLAARVAAVSRHQRRPPRARRLRPSPRDSLERGRRPSRQDPASRAGRLSKSS